MKISLALAMSMAVFLGGFQVGRASVRIGRHPGAATCTETAGGAGAGLSACRVCPGPNRNRLARVQFIPAGDTQGVDGAAPDSGGEPRPWPEALARPVRVCGISDLPADGRSCLIRPSAEHPAPLERSCVLRI